MALAAINAGKDEDHHFRSAVNVSLVYGWFLAFMTFVNMMKFLRLLRSSPFLAKLMSMIRGMSVEFSFFIVYLFLCMSAFGVYGYLKFGLIVEEYRKTVSTEDILTSLEGRASPPLAGPRRHSAEIRREGGISKQDNMGRKLRHVLVFLLIILKDPNMPEAACRNPTTSTPSVDAQNTFILTANKPEITRYGSHESSPSVSIPDLIGSVCGTAALSIVAAVFITIWCKRNTKNPPSGPSSNIALGNINTTATVPTSGSLHDQAGQGQSLASTQTLNIKHPSWASPPLRDDDEPTYVEPDGAHYMTPEDVLYEMPANSHCEDDNRHYYQPLKREQSLPTDASGYVLDNMGRKLRHVLVFLLIILKDPNMPEAACRNPTTSTPSVDAQNTFILTANKPEITRYGSHESSPSVSIPDLIGSVCGTAALSIVAAVFITIWCKRNTKNPPSGPSSNIALGNINTTATVPTSGSLHDQAGQGQSLASTQTLNIKHPSWVRGPPNPHTPKGLPPLRDDDEPTYVEPDGAHYMTPEDVLYEMPANSHCEDDNRHYYQPLKREQSLPTDASGYILVVPDNPKGQC
ncbi:hypothetical protein Bbelb_020250 [Branchiostoma belcheri]|nr:hypothetical protein Bbelb_020250 [Branchiostoma belcheri]